MEMRRILGCRRVPKLVPKPSLLPFTRHRFGNDGHYPGDSLFTQFDTTIIPTSQSPPYDTPLLFRVSC